MRIELKKPIILGEGATPITELHLREDVGAGDLRCLKLGAIADLSVDDVLTLAGRLSGQGAAVLNKMGVADTFEVLKAVGGFLSDGLEIGKT